MIRDYSKYKPFRFWCQKVLPLVYDDSLSYYELLNKVVDYLNNVIKDVNALGTAFEELDAMVNDYFDNLDVQEEINNKLDSMAEDGTLDAMIMPVVGDAVSDWLEDNVTPTGSAVVVDASLTISGAAADAKKTGDEISDLKSDISLLPYVNLFDATAITDGYYINSRTGVEKESSNWAITNYIPIPTNTIIQFGGYNSDKPTIVGFGYYDGNKSLISTSDYSASFIANGYLEQFPQDAKYIRFSITQAEKSTFFCNEKKLVSLSDLKSVSASAIDGVNVSKYIEDDAISGYWNTASEEVITHPSYKALPLIQVKQGDILYTKHAGTRTVVLYSDSGTVLDYRNFSNNDAKYHGFYKVVSDGFIGCSYLASNTDYEVRLNDSRIVESATINWLDIIIPEGWSTWVGKKAVMFGDSLVSGQRDDSAQGGAYCRRLKEHLSLTDCENKGRSGHPIADGTPNGDGTVTTVLSIADYSAYDLVIIAGGTNDFKLNVPIGSLSAIGSTFDRTTFYGALQTIFEYLMSKKANIRTCMWTPLQRNNDGYDIYYTNSAGHKLSDYCNAIKEVGKLYSVPIVDMYSISGVNMLDLSYYTVDGLHLNGAGYDIVSYIGAKQINVL